MQGDPHVRFGEQGVETDRLVSSTGEPHGTAPPPDSTFRPPPGYGVAATDLRPPELDSP